MSEDKRTKTELPAVAKNVPNSAEPMDKEYGIDLYELFLRLVEKWYWIALCAVICTIAMIIYTNRFITPQYVATSKIYVANSKDSIISVQDLQLANYLANDYLQVFDNWEMHEKVIQKLNLNYNYTQLHNMIGVSNPSNTRILVIKCMSPDKQEAKEIADAYAEVALDFFPEKMDTSSPKLFEKALLPTAPSSPNKSRNALLGFLIGAFAAMFVIIVRYVMDDYIRTEDDIAKCLHLPTLGTMLMQKDDKMFDEVDEAYETDGKRRKRT